MKYISLIFVSLIGSHAYSDNSTFRCVSNKVSAEAGIGHIKKYAGIDLEVKNGRSGLFNGDFVSVRLISRLHRVFMGNKKYFLA